MVALSATDGAALAAVRRRTAAPTAALMPDGSPAAVAAFGPPRWAAVASLPLALRDAHEAERERHDLVVRWESGYYDGVLSGFAESCETGEPYFFSVIPDAVDRRDRRYRAYPLTDGEWEREQAAHRDFEALVGHHACHHRLRADDVAGYGSGTDNPRRRLVRPRELHREFYARHPPEERRAALDTYLSRPAEGWFRL